MLHRARDKAGLSYSDLARMAGLSRMQIYRWADGEQQPSYHPVAALGAALERHHPQAEVVCGDLLAAAGYTPPVDDVPTAGDAWRSRVAALELPLADRQLLARLHGSADPPMLRLGARLLRFAERGPSRRRRDRVFRLAGQEVAARDAAVQRTLDMVDTFDGDGDSRSDSDTR